ncbi:MAG TPA: hypothetical protein PKW11_10610, partial [Pseudomonadota bacterium]|nr:hypothetical protein [Pseudomonadota bacterium]
SLSEVAEQRAELRWQQGRTEGKEEGLRDGILMVLRSRGVPIPADVEARILACKDVAMLSAWLQRAVSLSDAAELTKAC